MNTTARSRPWYREGMVWMVIAIPFTAVVLGIAMITIAVATWDGLVIDDYYTHGKEINRVLVRDRFAVEHGLGARLDYGDDGRISVALNAREEAPQPPAVTVLFLHPTRGGLDRTVELARGPDGLYHGVMEPLLEGRWHVQLGTDQWRIGALAEVGDAPLAVDLSASDAL